MGHSYQKLIPFQFIEQKKMMTTYISILRGINVGGNKKIKMDALRQMYTSLGYADVKTYIQSGNVIFRADETDITIIQKEITTSLLSTFGFDIPVLVFNFHNFSNALLNNPYIDAPLKDPAFIHLTFLSEEPKKEIIEQLLLNNYTQDEFCHLGKVIYIYCPSGYGNTKLTNNFFENKLKVTATTRNLRTCNELLEQSIKKNADYVSSRR